VANATLSQEGGDEFGSHARHVVREFDFFIVANAVGAEIPVEIK
jgi:hypothetical protein